MSLLPNLEDAVVKTARRHDRRQMTSRGRRRWSILATGAVALAVAGTVAVLVLGAGSRGRLDVVSEARAALAPQPGILHLVLSVQGKTYDSHGKVIPTSGQAAIAKQVVEQWSAKDPVRFRMITHASKETRPGTNRPLQERFEVSWANRTQTTYDAGNRTMRSVTHLSPRSSASQLPAIPGVDQSLDDIRTLLAEGQLNDAGLVTVDGRSLRRLTGRLTGMRDGGTVDYDVDPHTFGPVQITTRMKIGPVIGREMWTSIQIAKVKRLEHLPLSASTAELLKIKPPKGTTIKSQTLGEARAEGRRRRAAEKRRAQQMKASGNYRGGPIIR